MKKGFNKFWNASIVKIYEQILISYDAESVYKSADEARDAIYDRFTHKKKELEAIMAASDTIFKANIKKYISNSQKAMDRHKFAALLCHAILDSHPFKSARFEQSAQSTKPQTIIHLLPNEYFGAYCFFASIKAFQDDEKRKKNQKIESVLKISYPKSKDRVPYEVNFIKKLYWDYHPKVTVTAWSNLTLANIAYFFDSNGLIA